MPLRIIRNDITKVRCSAIVSAGNPSLQSSGGVGGAIHRAAGPELAKACRALGGCPSGQARITRGYNLPCEYVIHTAGPIWIDGNHDEEKILRSCYRESLRLAEENHCESVALPLIASGAFGYPKEEALQVAISEISRFLFHFDMEVILVIYDQASFQISKKLSEDIQEYIDENYVDAYEYAREERRRRTESLYQAEEDVRFAPRALEVAYPYEAGREESLEERIEKLDESFSQMLMRKIDEKGMTYSECYKKANIDRKLFSKIRKNVQYQPSKTTAVAFAVALELSLPETKDFLMKAGYALSHSNKFDVIIEYFILHHNYDIFEINETLFSFDQSLLGV